MKLTIISAQAIIGGRDDCVWTGDVGWGFDGHIGSTNERIFREFNRVDEGDHERLAELGYHLPSLSVGDVLYWHRKAYRVAGLGFEQITPEQLVMTSVFAALKPTEGDPDDD